MSDIQPVVVIHGGAWAVPDSVAEPVLQGVKEAALESYKLLTKGSTSVDAVVAAVSMLEDNPLYDAGRGSCLNTEGGVEMHAIVMEGKTLSTGGVVAIRNVKNPVLAAKLVLEKTQHCALAGEGALALAREYGLQEMPPEYFITPLAKDELEKYLKYNKTVTELFNKERGHDTVGAVALDKFGNLACATSSGGITAQLPGRVSDTPMVGAGGYADNDSAAISTTGHGESITKVSLARLASIFVEQGSSPQKSVTRALQFMKRRINGQGGMIAVDRQGQVGIGFTTERMSWAVIGGKTSSELHNVEQGCVTFGIDPDERRTEYLSI